MLLLDPPLECLAELGCQRPGTFVAHAIGRDDDGAQVTEIDLVHDGTRCFGPIHPLRRAQSRMQLLGGDDQLIPEELLARASSSGVDSLHLGAYCGHPASQHLLGDHPVLRREGFEHRVPMGPQRSQPLGARTLRQRPASRSVVPGSPGPFTSTRTLTSGAVRGTGALGSGPWRGRRDDRRLVPSRPPHLDPLEAVGLGLLGGEHRGDLQAVDQCLRLDADHIADRRALREECPVQLALGLARTCLPPGPDAIGACTGQLDLESRHRP